MKYYINGHWYSELQRQIKLNDLLNNLREALDEYKRFHKRPIKKK